MAQGLIMAKDLTVAQDLKLTALLMRFSRTLGLLFVLAAFMVPFKGHALTFQEACVALIDALPVTPKIRTALRASTSRKLEGIRRTARLVQLENRFNETKLELALRLADSQRATEALNAFTFELSDKYKGNVRQDLVGILSRHLDGSSPLPTGSLHDFFRLALRSQIQARQRTLLSESELNFYTYGITIFKFIENWQKDHSTQDNESVPQPIQLKWNYRLTDFEAGSDSARGALAQWMIEALRLENLLQHLMASDASLEEIAQLETGLFFGSPDEWMSTFLTPRRDSSQTIVLPPLPQR